MVRVVVEDEGPGLPPGDPRLLFEKFQRGREENAVVGAGLGSPSAGYRGGHGGGISAGSGRTAAPGSSSRSRCRGGS